MQSRLGAARAAAVLAAVVAVAVSGCASSGHGAGKTAASAGNAAQLLSAAVRNAQSVNSIVAATNVQVSSIPDAGALGALGLTTSGTYTAQSHPSSMREFAGTIQAGGQSVGAIDLISAPAAVYVKLPPMLKMLLHSSKPWSMVSQSELKSGGIVASVLGEAQAVDPLAFVQLLGKSANPRIAGTATINGAATTEVTGSVPASAALANLPASLRSSFAQVGTGQIEFQTWIDAQHNFRKLIVSKAGSDSEGSNRITFTVSNINQPVNVSVPSASQVAAIPASALRGM